MNIYGTTLIKYFTVKVNYNSKKIMILVPHLKGIGGVQNYYNTLKLEDNINAYYFSVNALHKQSKFKKAFRIIYNYILFFYKVIKHKIHLIHINPSLEYKSFYREAVFILLSRLLKRKILIFFRGWREDFEKQIQKSAFKRFIFRISYAKADKYVVLSTLFKNKLIKLGVSKNATFFIETTVADSRYLDSLSLKEKFETFTDKVIFLFLSKVERSKGIYIAIDAFEKFLKRNPNRKSIFLIAGDGKELEAARSYVISKSISQINFLGAVSNEQKKQVLLASHIMLFPSYTEGLPNSILEGMLYGMPIVSRITGGIPDVVNQGINGFLSDSMDGDIYEKYISTLATDGELYKEIAFENHTKAFSKFTTEKVKERILNIYKTILN